MLAEARTVGEVLAVLSIADAARTYARARDLGVDARNYAADIVLRAQRRLGELIKADPEIRRGGSKSRPVTLPPEVTRMQSHRAQAMAAIPIATFEAHVSKVLAAREELTASELMRRAERGIGVSIRQGQEAGTIATIAEMKSYASHKGVLARGDRVGNADLVSDPKPTPADLGMSREDLYQRGAGIYKLTDGVSDVAFEAAIAEARAG